MHLNDEFLDSVPKLGIMNTPSDYTAYLITAINSESAAIFAAEHHLEDNSWFRLPSTLNDNPELFKKETTPVLSKYHWAEFNDVEAAAHSLTGQSKVRILFAKDFGSAARYASKHNWWLHAWTFVADESAEEVIEYGFYGC